MTRIVLNDARFLAGRVVESVRGGGGQTGKGSTYVIEAEDGQRYTCDYTDIVTESFRTMRNGDRVRFRPLADMLGLQATHVIKLDEPGFEELYPEWGPQQ